MLQQCSCHVALSAKNVGIERDKSTNIIQLFPIVCSQPINHLQPHIFDHINILCYSLVLLPLHPHTFSWEKKKTLHINIQSDNDEAKETSSNMESGLGNLKWKRGLSIFLNKKKSEKKKVKKLRE